MGVKNLVRRSGHALTAVPRLWRAALRAGIGTTGAIEVLRISEAAARVASTHGRGVPGRTNAMRHFMWQALITARFDRDVAEAIARAQEAGSPNREDSRADVRNNAAGRDHGQRQAPALGAVALSQALEQLVPVALEKWERGELVWVRRR